MPPGTRSTYALHRILPGHGPAQRLHLHLCLQSRNPHQHHNLCEKYATASIYCPLMRQVSNMCPVIDIGSFALVTIYDLIWIPCSNLIQLTIYDLIWLTVSELIQLFICDLITWFFWVILDYYRIIEYDLGESSTSNSCYCTWKWKLWGYTINIFG